MITRRDFLKLASITLPAILTTSRFRRMDLFYYKSSRDMTAITNLYSLYTYAGVSDLPIVVMAHAWGGDATSFGSLTLDRIAANGAFFVISPGLRGRNNATGARDASGREIMDIYDAITYVRSNFSFVSQTKCAIVGYSGGGGNALAAACKFPDLFNVVVDYFGISDYGRDGTDGWYTNNGSGSYTDEIVTAIGGTPAQVPNNYYARDATAAIANYSGGFLYLYHDKQDTLVPWAHSNRIKTAMDNASLTNYAASFTDTGDPTRWLHGYPADVPALLTAEPTWTAKIKSQDVWTIPASGTVTVLGYMITKRFTIWLNTGATLGVDAVATVAYNTATDTYTVTPLTTGAMDVTITQGAKTGGVTDITEATQIVVS